jgi:hypothetical protein
MATYRLDWSNMQKTLNDLTGRIHEIAHIAHEGNHNGEIDKEKADYLKFYCNDVLKAMTRINDAVQKL